MSSTLATIRKLLDILETYVCVITDKSSSLRVLPATLLNGPSAANVVFIVIALQLRKLSRALHEGRGLISLAAHQKVLDE